MYPAPSSPWSVHPDTNSHPKLETGTPCSGGPAGAGPGRTSLPQHGLGHPSLLSPSLPPECPGLSPQGPAVWECPRSRGSVAQLPCPVGMPRSVAQAPCPAAPAPGQPRKGVPGHCSRPWIAPALCAPGFSCGLKPRAGLGWVCFPAGFCLALPTVSALTVLRALSLSPPCPFSSIRGELECSDLGKGNPARAQ